LAGTVGYFSLGGGKTNKISRQPSVPHHEQLSTPETLVTGFAGYGTETPQRTAQSDTESGRWDGETEFAPYPTSRFGFTSSGDLADSSIMHHGNTPATMDDFWGPTDWNAQIKQPVMPATYTAATNPWENPKDDGRMIATSPYPEGNAPGAFGAEYARNDDVRLLGLNNYGSQVVKSNPVGMFNPPAAYGGAMGKGAPPVFTEMYTEPVKPRDYVPTVIMGLGNGQSRERIPVESQMPQHGRAPLHAPYTSSAESGGGSLYGGPQTAPYHGHRVKLIDFTPVIGLKAGPVGAYAHPDISNREGGRVGMKPTYEVMGNTQAASGGQFAGMDVHPQEAPRSSRSTIFLRNPSGGGNMGMERFGGDIGTGQHYGILRRDVGLTGPVLQLAPQGMAQGRVVGRNISLRPPTQGWDDSPDPVIQLGARSNPYAEAFLDRTPEALQTTQIYNE
jgi:hypothetical protein